MTPDYEKGKLSAVIPGIIGKPLNDMAKKGQEIAVKVAEKVRLENNVAKKGQENLAVEVAEKVGGKTNMNHIFHVIAIK